MSFEILGTEISARARRTNEELSALVDTSDEWISRRVGVQAETCCTRDRLRAGLPRALAALEMSGTAPGELVMICAPPSRRRRSTSCLYGSECLAAVCPAMDISALFGFVYMLGRLRLFLPSERQGGSWWSGPSA
jgi:3-oxoacyl-[acyl-carrier-protein] synthase-3